MSIIFDIDKLHKKINFSLFPEIIYVLKIKLKKIYILTYIYIYLLLLLIFSLFSIDIHILLLQQIYYI